MRNVLIALAFLIVPIGGGKYVLVDEAGNPIAGCVQLNTGVIACG